MCAVASSVQELIALRKLQKSQLRQGIEVEKLNRGDVKKRPATEAGKAEVSLGVLHELKGVIRG